MENTFSKQWFRWLTPIWLLLVLGLVGCSGQLGSTDDTDPAGGTGGTTPPDQPSDILPATPTVIDVSIETTEKAVVRGSCTRNANTAYSADFIDVSIKDGDKEVASDTTTCEASGLGDKWTVKFDAGTFTKGPYSIVAIARSQAGKLSMAGYGTLKVTDGSVPVGSSLLPAVPTINMLSILTTQKALITGTCTHSEIASSNIGTDYVAVSVEGKSSINALCLPDDTWNVDFGTFQANVYPMSVKAVNQTFDEESASRVSLLSVTSATKKLFITLKKAEIEAGQFVNIDVQVKDQTGKALTGDTILKFSSECLSVGQAKMQTLTGEEQVEFTSSLGAVTANYVADGCVGTDKVSITGSFEGEGVSSASPINITVGADKVQQIRWISSLPNLIYTKGTSKNQISTITFEVIGESGAKVVGEKIDFVLKSNANKHGLTGADLKLLDGATDISNKQGLVTAKVQSGYKTDNVTITAIYEDDDTGKQLEFYSEDLVIVNGLTSYGNFTISVDNHSPLAFNRKADEQDKVKVKASVNDRYGKAVADGTLVTFKVEGTQPSQPGVGAIGKFYSVNEADVTDDNHCRTVGGDCAVYWAPNGRNGNAPGGYVTIMGIVKGEENYDDINENGYFDEGDVHYDVQEPFLDHKAYLVRKFFIDDDDDALVSSKYVEGEFYLEDTNDDGIRNKKNGLFDGANCDDETICSNKGLIDVASSVTFYQSSDDINICQHFDQFGLAQVPINEVINLTGFKVCDGRSGGQIPAGSVIEFTAEEGSIVGFDGHKIQGQKPIAPYLKFDFKASSTPKTGGVSPSVTVLNEDILDQGDIVHTLASMDIDIIIPSGYKPKNTSINYRNLTPNNTFLTKRTKGYGRVLIMRNGVDLTGKVYGPCSSSEMFGTIPIDTVVGVMIGGRGVYTLSCDTDTWAIDAPITSNLNKPGEYTLAVAKVSLANANLVNPDKNYIGNISVSKIFVANTPDAASLDSSLFKGAKKEKNYLTGSCNASNTTQVEVELLTNLSGPLNCNDDRWYWMLPESLQGLSSGDSIDVTLQAFNEKDKEKFQSSDEDNDFHTTKSSFSITITP